MVARKRERGETRMQKSMRILSINSKKLKLKTSVFVQGKNSCK